MNMLSTWILTVLMAISPPSKVSKWSNETSAGMQSRYESIAQDMAQAIQESKPLFTGKNAEVRTAALITSIGLYESGFRKEVDEGTVRGDGGRSWCLMQINLGSGTVPVGDDVMRSWKGKDLVKDRKKCFKVALEMVRLSMNQCSSLTGGSVLSGYTSGKCVANERTAVSRWRFSRQILAKYPYNN